MPPNGGRCQPVRVETFDNPLGSYRALHQVFTVGLAASAARADAPTTVTLHSPGPEGRAVGVTPLRGVGPYLAFGLATATTASTCPAVPVMRLATFCKKVVRLPARPAAWAAAGCDLASSAQEIARKGRSRPVVSRVVV